MKKFYAFAAAAAMAITMSAQAPLYITGEGDAINNWSPDAPAEMTFADGKYTFTAELNSFKISTAKGTWDEFNAGCYTLEAKPKEPGTYNLVAGYANINTPWKGEYTITVAGDLSTITFETESQKPADTLIDCYIRGTVNDWSGELADLEIWKMETNATVTTVGTVYWFDCVGDKVIPAGSEIKCAGADWQGGINYTPGKYFDFGEAMDCAYNNGDNILIEEDYSGTIKLELVNGPFEPAKITLYETVVPHESAGIADITVDENAPVEYFNLQGVRVANPENGLYIVRQGAKTFKKLVK